jgi:UDP-N-acetylglucosamine acyltransferase
MTIHPSSIIDSKAKIAKDVVIGPFCTIGPNVEIASGTQLMSHVVIDGHTIIGKNNTIYPFASIGLAPQDLKFKGEKSKLIIGNGNTIREYATIHPGTAEDNNITTIGDNNLFMIQSHIAHDCVVGSGVILANGATLAGHVTVGDNATIGGLSAVHQFVRIGHNAFIGGLSAATKDIPPFTIASSPRSTLDGLNLVGLRRKGFDKETIQAMQKALKYIFFSTEGSLLERVEHIEKEKSKHQEIQDIIDFVRTSDRGLCLPSEAKVK